QVIPGQYKSEHYQVQQRKGDRKRLAGQKGFDASMVADALHDVAKLLDVEKRNRQTHQFGKELGKDSQVEPYADVQQDPTADKARRCLSKHQRQLGGQYQVDERKVLGVDPHIDDRLGQKGKQEL